MYPGNLFVFNNTDLAFKEARHLHVKVCVLPVPGGPSIILSGLAKALFKASF